MEQAGLVGFSDACCSGLEDSTSADDHCAADLCDELESQLIKPAGHSGSVAPLFLTQLVGLRLIIPEQVDEDVPLLSPERTDIPPELLRTWQFTVRAALQPRAPGLAS